MRVMSSTQHNSDNHKDKKVDTSAIQDEMSTLTHNLMGSLSALVMCEHMISKELSSYEVLQENSPLQTSLGLLKLTIDQIKGNGEDLMEISHRWNEATGRSEPSV